MSAAPSPYRRNDTDDSAGRRRDNDRRDRDGGRGGRGGREGRGNVHFARDTGTPCLTSSITHLTCNCGGADVNSTYRQCLVYMRNTTTYFNALTLFHGCLNLVCQQGSSEVVRTAATWGYSSRSAPCSVQPTRRPYVQMSSSIYGTVVFDLTFFNEVTKSDNILKNIEANVIDSCIEVIIGMPDIRSHRLVHRIPS